MVSVISTFTSSKHWFSGRTAQLLAVDLCILCLSPFYVEENVQRCPGWKQSADVEWSCQSCSLLCCFFQGAGQDRLGIYIKSVVKGGAADAVS
jgi:hypothetical protein